MINRALYNKIADKLQNDKRIIILYGARQLGKTTLSREIIKDLGYKTLYINADLNKHHSVLSSRDLKKLRNLTDGYDLLFIDEAQRIKDLGINLKILNDELPNLKVFVTGSSSFDIAHAISDSLAGRKWPFTMYPLSLTELSETYNRFELDEMKEDLLLYGGYPEVIMNDSPSRKIDILEEIIGSYLYKDVLELSNIRNSIKIHKLLELLAYRIGSEISINKLSQELEMSREVIIKYLDLLEKAFIIYRLPGYNRNLSKEIRKQDKFYFYDLGIRNMIIEDFRPFDKRMDKGGMWENFIIMERIKSLRYNGDRSKFYFWRVYTGGEIDLIETKGKSINAVEIKYKKNRKTPPKSWTEAYPGTNFITINKDNYLDVILV